MTDITNREYLPTLAIFLLGGGFGALLMYYTSISKHFYGLYNDSIFMVAVYFGYTAAITLYAHHILK